MESQTGNPHSKKGRLTPLSEDPQMDRLAEIVKKLPPDRQEAFGEWLEDMANEGNEFDNKDLEDE